MLSSTWGATESTHNGVVRRIILGSGRSGTTWVQDSLAEANALRPIFEPLHDGNSELGRRYAYGVMAPGDTDDSLERFFVSLCEGRIHSRWIDYRGATALLFPRLSKLASPRGLRNWIYVWGKYLRDRSSLYAATQRKDTIIKCIRANLMAGWLSQDLGFRTVVIVRHPCATIESRFRSESAWDPIPLLHRYRSDRRLHELTAERYLPLLNAPLTKVQALAVNWVIENQLLTERAAQGGYAVFHYEHLVNQPELAWPAVCRALGLNKVPTPDLLGKSSQQTYRQITSHSGAEQTSHWRRALTADQLTQIQGVLEATEFGLYRVGEDEPLESLRSG